mgnify:CR=1 FL=1
MKRLSIDPITRLEGHGRIDMFIGDDGLVDAAYLVIPELRGFEKFMEGRPVEELPLITPRICGVCPEAHHYASVKAADAVFGLEIPEAAFREHLSAHSPALMALLKVFSERSRHDLDSLVSCPYCGESVEITLDPDGGVGLPLPPGLEDLNRPGSARTSSWPWRSAPGRRSW